ncbi:MAG: hypothetical protein IJP11_03930 [Oscillospiraceae bacterium]|nr:hypothetical protein [Oscillospiraceae bacterium]
MKKKRLKISRLVPPGFDYGPELKALCWIVGGALVLSLFWFTDLREARRALFDRYLGVLRPIPGAVMRDFGKMVWPYMSGFAVAALWALSFVGVHYQYHHRVSKSIYTMKRLPNRLELHLRCWTLPLSCFAAILLAGFLLLLIYYAVYLLVTPAENLAPDQWKKLWSVIL